MKKQIVAYARNPSSKGGQSKQPNKEHSQEFLKHNTSQPNLSHNPIYGQIMDQMASQHYKYINKLLNKQEKGQKNQQTLKQSQNKSSQGKQRTKSYTNIIIQNLMSTDLRNTLDKCQKLKEKKPKLKNKKSSKNQIFFSQKGSPLAPKLILSPKKNKKPLLQSQSFLNHLDNYIFNISSCPQTDSDRKGIFDRKTILREPNSHTQLMKKFQTQEKKIKQMKLNNQILKIQETKQRKKNKELKEKLHDMLDHVKKLTANLEREKHQRKKMSKFFKEFQQKFKSMCPQRKTTACKGKKSDQFLFSQNTTELEEQIDMIFGRNNPLEGKQRSSRNYSVSKTRKLNKNIYKMLQFNEESEDSVFGKEQENSEEMEFDYD